MQTPSRNIILLTLTVLASSTDLCSQEARPSPAAHASIELNGKAVSIDYSSPRMRGRKIFGELVPYGQVWRTGANEATLLKTAVDLDIAGAHVPAGSYTLYTLPSKDTWKLIINKQTGQSGTEYDQAQDLARVDLEKAALTGPLEAFTIEFKKTASDTAALLLEWETTKLSVPIRSK